MNFRNKIKLIEFVKTQTGIALENEPDDVLNRKRTVLHTTITDCYGILPVLQKYEIRYEHHIGNGYFIYVR